MGGGACATGREAARLSPDWTSPSAGAGRTDGCGQGQETAVRSAPLHEAVAARKERRVLRRETARKLKLFGFKFSDKILILTIPQKRAEDANVANVIHPAGEPKRPTGSATRPRGSGKNAVLLIPG